ncbi:MAG: hypothetical protein IKF99_08655 [Oscillospiraceae bacterium]|nr:hypothetical protein [Oscillospiraceae bacterium]
MNIARWTTPSITYKPKLVNASDIAEIRMEISQGSYNIVKTQTDATLSEGRFYWRLSQEETSGLVTDKTGVLQIDYVSNAGDRYTTQRHILTISNSAIDEVIS